jgi:hypothetical protein
MENVLLPLMKDVTLKKVNCMAKCPKCGKEISTPKKSWKMCPGRPGKDGKKTELTIGLFEHCGKSFRAALGKRKI